MGIVLSGSVIDPMSIMVYTTCHKVFTHVHVYGIYNMSQSFHPCTCVWYIINQN